MSLKLKGINQQIADSIDKLFHYLLVFTRKDVNVKVLSGLYNENILYEGSFKYPRRISISPTLFTRIDNCFGAGNCCRVPFDLVYTVYDYSRIEQYDHKQAVEVFGAESGEVFEKNRKDLLSRLTRVRVEFDYGGADRASADLFIRQSTQQQRLSNVKSCPYLYTGEDRYYCGVHPFKPLHCWYPHMTIRSTDVSDDKRPSISIGRMQYGRNHNFGCPVIFVESSTRSDSDIFMDSEDVDPYYFQSQYQDDFDKLEWTARSARSLGLGTDSSLAVDLHERFALHVDDMKRSLDTKSKIAVPLILSKLTY